MDRAAMGAATPQIMQEFELSKIQMGWAASAFNWAYALFQVPAGWMADRYGPRLILGVAVAWWSIFTGATGLAFNAVSLGVTRFLFGMGEAAAFPAASRAVVRWLPFSRRAFGQGFQHAGSRLGAAVTPALVAFLITVYNWKWAFFLFAAAGLVLAVVWVAYFRNYPEEHPAVNPEEREVLRISGVPAKPKGKLDVPWRNILRSADLWCLSIMYFCYGWVLWLYLAWLPTYLAEARNFAQLKMGLAASVPLLAATITNIAGGWLSDRLARIWGDLRRGRVMVSLCGFAIAGAALIPGVLASNASTALAWLTVALAGLELTVAVSWAMALDIGGDYSGSVSAVMNTFGNLGGAFAAVCIGYIATLLGWNWVFGSASAMCVFAGLLATRIDPNRAIRG
jgi:MFS family permease